MQRYKWFHCDCPLSISELAAALRSNPFTHDVKHGFILEKVRPDFLTARFLVKNETEESVIDPLDGTISNFIRVSYDEVNFKIYDSIPSLEVIEPPRKLVRFLNEFSLVIGDNITVYKVNVDLIKLYDAISTELSRLKITAVDCSNILLSISCAAKLSISGIEDVKVYVEQMVGSKSYCIDKAKITYMRQNGTYSYFEVSKSGSVKLSDFDAEYLLPIIKKHLGPLVSQSMAL
jgi:hypothetical protein